MKLTRSPHVVLHPRFSASTLAAYGLLLALPGKPAAQVGTVAAEHKISATTGGFGGLLDREDLFGFSVCALGDLDGDGVTDLAVGAVEDDDGDGNQGAVWILFLNSDGTVASEQKISETSGGFGGDLDPYDWFGASVAALGDLDGDGVTDIAVGAAGDAQGAVWILFLNPDGTVASEQKISETTGGFGGDLDFIDEFGISVAALGDLDGDGIEDLAVGAFGDDDGGNDAGAVWILFLDSDGTVASEQKISETSGGFGGDLHDWDSFGSAVCGLGDLDGNGVGDLAVGAQGDITTTGAVWILFLNSDGTVASERKITETTGGFGGDLGLQDWFGSSVYALGDLDGDGVVEVAVGARGDDDCVQPLECTNQGAVWILFLNSDGTVASERKISETMGDFGGSLDRLDEFGASICALGDLDGDGVGDVAVGAPGDDDNDCPNPVFCTDQGAVWILFLNGPQSVTLDFETEDDFVTPLGNGQKIDTEFGRLVRISGAGANAGPAVFDTTPGGPNDPPLNDDMLIEHGNVLLLEDDWYAWAQTIPGYFDQVTDDPHGGDLMFDFLQPVNPRSLLLADINPPPNLGASVTLTDGNGRTRVYAVEPGWTGGYGNAGPWQLDLTTTVPQPGNGTPRFATATEDPGFLQTNVVRMVVHMTGFGAIDDLSLWLPQASATTRNGSGGNPLILRSGSRPVLGSTWRAELDCSAYGSGIATLVMRSRANPGTMTPFGEVLVAGDRLFSETRTFPTAPNTFTWVVPHDMALLGLDLHLQGSCHEALSASTRGKTRRAHGCLSNALDLVLGF